MQKSNFDDEFEVISTKKTRWQRHIVELEPITAYQALPVTKAKKNDLLSLCRDGSIPALYHPFYEALPCDSIATDRLPETGCEESEEDE